MKKILFIAVILMTIPAFNSCVGDDGNTICVFSCSQDLLDICDVVLKYQDKNGDTISNKVTSTQWIKTYDSKTHPLVIWLDYELKPKEGAKDTKKYYHLKAEYQIVTLGGAVHCSAQIVPEFITNTEGALKSIKQASEKEGAATYFKVYSNALYVNNSAIENDIDIKASY